MGGNWEDMTQMINSSHTLHICATSNADLVLNGHVPQFLVESLKVTKHPFSGGKKNYVFHPECLEKWFFTCGIEHACFSKSLQDLRTFRREAVMLTSNSYRMAPWCSFGLSESHFYVSFKCTMWPRNLRGFLFGGPRATWKFRGRGMSWSHTLYLKLFLLLSLKHPGSCG